MPSAKSGAQDGVLSLSWGFSFVQPLRFHPEKPAYPPYNHLATAKINLRSRRSKFDQRDAAMEPSEKYAFGPFRLDVEQGLFCRNKRVPLGNKAFALLEMLLTNRNKVVLFDAIWKKIWPHVAVDPRDTRQYTRYINVQADHIRKVLGKYGSCIKNIRGRGYWFSNDAL